MSYQPSYNSLHRMLVFLFLFVVSVSGQTLSFTSMGAQSVFPLFNEWFFAYKQQKPNISFTYTPVGSAPANAAIVSNAVDFSTAATSLASSVNASTTPANDILQFPICGSAFVFAYNLPYGNLAYGSSPQLTVTLSLPVVGKIFALQITNWRDPQIISLQTSAVAALLPNATILVAARTDAGAITTLVQTLAQESDPTWPWGTPATTWNATYLNQSNVIPVYNTWGAASAVTSTPTPNTIAYIPYATVVSDSGYTYAQLINRNGDTVYTPDMQAAVAASNWTSNFVTTGLTNSATPGAWPFAAVVYVYFRVQNFSTPTCAARRELFLFFNWALTDPWAQSRMSSMGFNKLGSLNSPLMQNVLAMLQTIQCPASMGGSVPFLQYIPLPQHQSSGFIAVAVLSSVVAVLMIVMVIVYLVRDRKKLSTTACIFFLLLVLGASFNYVSLWAFYTVPSSNSVCQARLWLVCLGFTTMLSAIFCRGYQIRAIQQLAASKKMAGGVRHMLIQVAGNGVLVLLQIVLLTIWIAVDTFQSAPDGLDTLNLTFLYICKSSQPIVWWGLEILFVMSLLFFGLYVVYVTWDLKHMVKESKWIAISVYNCIVSVALLLALFLTLNVSDDTVFWLAGCSTFFLTTTIMLALFLPRVLALKSLADVSDSSVTGSKATYDKGSTVNKPANSRGFPSGLSPSPASPRRSLDRTNMPQFVSRTSSPSPPSDNRHIRSNSLSTGTSSCSKASYEATSRVVKSLAEMVQSSAEQEPRSITIALPDAHTSNNNIIMPESAHTGNDAHITVMTSAVFQNPETHSVTPQQC